MEIENQNQEFKQIVTQNVNITIMSVCFGLFSHLVYSQTGSRIHFISRFYAPVLRDELKDLFRLDDAAFDKSLRRGMPYEQAANGNMLVECCISADKQFAALRLCQWGILDYQPVSNVYFLQGEAVTHVARVFSL